MLNRENINEIRDKLQKDLKKARYIHTLGVEYTSAALAMRYNCDMIKAEVGGLLHDCAKKYNENELIDRCHKDDIYLSDESYRSPQIIHAIYGEYLARNIFNIKDKDILAAIRWHTTGRENMTIYDKIVYVADYIEPSRYKADNLDEIRKIAFEDLTYAVYKIAKDTLEYLDKNKLEADSMTYKCYKYLMEHGIYDRNYT